MRRFCRTTVILLLNAGAMCWLFGMLFGTAWGETSSVGPHYSLRYWLREDGLPYNTVTAVVQGHDGYIWIGTYNGLARFDGVRFTVFDSDNTPALVSSRVTSLFESDDDVLWIGHEAGELTRYANGKFENCPVAPRWLHKKIIGIVADERGDIWVQNEDSQLARVRDGLILTPEPGLYGGITSLARTQEGTVWVGRNGRISELHEGRLTPLLTDVAFTNRTFIGIGAGRDGGLWLVTTNQVREWKNGQWVKDRGGTPFQGAPMSKIIETRNGTLIGASSDHGFAIIRPDGTANVFNHANGFSSDWVIDLCVDHEGGIWIGTGGAGLALVRDTCVQNIAPPDTWHGRALLSVYGDRDGSLWVGAEGVGLYHFQDDTWTNYSFPSGLENPYVWSIASDSSSNLWVGTWSGGLYVRRGERFEKAPGLENMLTPVTALLPAKQGGLWIGTASGLMYYDRAGKSTSFARPESPVENDVRCLLETPDGILSFGTSGQGFSQLYRNQLKSFRRTDGLASDFVQCLHEDDNGALWIGTSGGGLCRFKGGRFTTINKQQGLPDNVICDIEDDGLGYYWMSSYKGIIRVSKAALNQCADLATNEIQCLDFGISDGMPTLQCSGGGCKTGDGQLWFTTSRGLVTINPRAVKINLLPPPVVVEKLLVDGQATDIEPQLNSPLKILPGRHRLEFQYAGLSFAAPEKVRFKHRLDGLDSDWIDAGTEHTVDYNYIPPGHYTFRLVACNDDGVWNENGVTLAVVVLPYFWQTAWFRILAMSGLLASAGGGAWFGTRRRMRIKLERVERQRALERERTRIAKDIHDDLGASLTRINLMSQSARRGMDDVQQTVKSLDQICTTARQLTRAMDEIVWAVDPQHDTLDSLASYLGKLIHELLGDSGIRCRLDFPLYLPAWPLSAEVRHNLFLAVKESLHNILKHSAAKEVKITFVLEASAFTVCIMDDGRGFVPGAVSGSNATHRNGLVNMSQRLREIGGRCEIHSQPGQGTQVTFFVPISDGTKDGTRRLLSSE
jgi:signal transduction histidine kinase/ligand-binding sensor domain-containing protein